MNESGYSWVEELGYTKKVVVLGFLDTSDWAFGIVLTLFFSENL